MGVERREGLVLKAGTRAASTTRVELLAEAVEAIEDTLDEARGDGEKDIAPRDRIAALKAILDLKLQILEATEDAEGEAARMVERSTLTAQVSALRLVVLDLRQENAELKARIEDHRETQAAWDNDGT